MPNFHVIDTDVPNSGKGDKLRTAMEKVNANFAMVAGEGIGAFEAKSASFTAEAFKTYAVDTTAGTVTATLPLDPSPGDSVRVMDAGGVLSTYAITVSRNGKKINGAATDFSMAVNYAVRDFFYVNATVGWIVR